MGNPIIEKLKLPKMKEMEYTVAYETPKDKRKFIKRVKSIVRQSKEYKDYIRFLKEYMDMSKCAFFNNVKMEEGKKVKVEIHHDPFTLEDIVSIVINKFLDEGQRLNDLDIADEVMELHYQNKVGLVPLSVTLHELAHADTDKRLFIPLILCYGDYNTFVKEYYDYMDDDLKTKLENKIEKTEEVDASYFDSLNAKFIYLDIDEVDELTAIPVEEEMVA